MHDVIIFHQTIATNHDDRWLGWDREGLCLADRATNEFTPIIPISVARDIMAGRPKDVRITIMEDEDVPYLWNHNGIDILVVWNAKDKDATVFGPTYEGEDGKLTRRLEWRSPRNAGADNLAVWDKDSFEDTQP